MRSRTPAQIQAEKLKSDITERLASQIESLGKSGLFEMDELFELFIDTIQKTGCFDMKEFSTECDKVCLDGMKYLIPNVDLVQETELENFCKEKGIKLLTYLNI
jgi:hypothetical protein